MSDILIFRSDIHIFTVFVKLSVFICSSFKHLIKQEKLFEIRKNEILNAIDTIFIIGFYQIFLHFCQKLPVFRYSRIFSKLLKHFK